MPAVSSTSVSVYEAIGYRLSSPPIQMEAKGFVMRGAQSAQEALQGTIRARSMNYESTATLISSTIISIYERLLSVKAIF
jgi:hypothetical protein